MKSIFKKFLCLALTAVAITGLFASDSFSSESEAASKNIVVVLDPGHDTTHTGCQYMGIDEGTVNLYIAYYCKQELEKYDGVTVYMTRYGWDCAYGADEDSASSCLSGRVNYAKSVNADVFISIHNDYDGDLDTSVNGCKVIIQNPNYKPALCVTDTNLASSILTELTKTGLNINNWKLCPNGTGIVTRDSTGGLYPDGSAKDYYAVLNKTKSLGMPGIIIEHAYVTNDSDRLNHLSTTTQLQELGVADATGIANYYGLTLK